MEINCFGNKYWKLPNGDLHRDNDLPAVEWADGAKEWWLNGDLHRGNDLPAIEYKNGEKYWYVNGKLHRTDGSAFENASGHKLWYLENVRYSEEEFNEKVKMISTYSTSGSGVEHWRLPNGSLHRENNLPAKEYTDGTQKWFFNGKLHRTNGPAIEWANGDKYWYLEGIRYSKEEYNEKVKTISTCKIYENGDKRWRLPNGKLHRENDLPAAEWLNGSKFWYVNGLNHRTNGPAVEYAGGDKYWWLEGVRYSEEEYNNINKTKNENENDMKENEMDEQPEKKYEEGGSTSKLDKVKSAGSKIGSSIKHGFAVGAATEGANLAFNFFFEKLGLPKEFLNDPIKKEILMGLSVAALYVGSSVYEEQVPGMKRLQNGCELVIEGKSKDNFTALTSHVLPMLMQASELMKPNSLINSLTKQEKLRVENVNAISSGELINEEEGDYEQANSITRSS